jgi:hypothetical protein
MARARMWVSAQFFDAIEDQVLLLNCLFCGETLCWERCSRSSSVSPVERRQVLGLLRRAVGNPNAHYELVERFANHGESERKAEHELFSSQQGCSGQENKIIRFSGIC